MSSGGYGYGIGMPQMSQMSGRDRYAKSLRQAQAIVPGATPGVGTAAPRGTLTPYSGATPLPASYGTQGAGAPIPGLAAPATGAVTGAPSLATPAFGVPGVAAPAGGKTLARPGSSAFGGKGRF